MYDDNYDTCSETYVTMRLYFNEKSPEELTQFLGIQPTETQIKGQKSKLRPTKLNELNGWFLSSENMVNSKDSRRHIDYLADKLIPLKPKLDELIKVGAKIDISCFWLSKSGQGGPTLSAQQLSKLAQLGLTFWYDFYPVGD